MSRETLLALAESVERATGPDAVIERLCELHQRPLACFQSPTGQPSPRRPRWFEPTLRDSETALIAAVELERMKAILANVRLALPVLRDLLKTIHGLDKGVERAEEMIGEVDTALRARAGDA